MVITWADLIRMTHDEWVTAERAATIAALDRAAHEAALAEERELRDPGSYRVDVGKDPWQ